jgi:hypothetical protein
LQSVKPDARIAGSERAILEDRIVEKIGCGHRHLHSIVGECLLELADDPIALGSRRINRHQIVVMKIDTIGAQPA